MRILTSQDAYNHHPFAGSGTSVYATLGTTVQYRRLRVLGLYARGTRRGRIKGRAGVHAIGAGSITKTARVTSVADPGNQAVLNSSSAWSGQTVAFDVRRFADHVECETDNYRTLLVTYDANLNEQTEIRGSATLLSIEPRSGGVVRIRFRWQPASDGIAATRFRAVATAGPTSPTDAVVSWDDAQQVPRIIQIDTPALSDAAPYTYKIVAANSDESVTADVLTGLAVQADATGPPAPSSVQVQTV